MGTTDDVAEEAAVGTQLGRKRNKNNFVFNKSETDNKANRIRARAPKQTN